MKKLTPILLVLIAAGTASAASTDYYLKIEGVDGESTKSSTAGESKTITVTGSLTVESGVLSLGERVFLDATRSQDDGTVRTFAWKQVGGPTVRIENPSSSKASVVPTSAGTYVFELSVTDENGRPSGTSKVQFKAGNSAPAASASPTATPKQGGGNVEYEWKVEEGESAPAASDDRLINAGPTDEWPLTPDFSILLGGGGDDDAEAQGRRDEVAKILSEGMQESDRPTESLSLNFGKLKATVRHKLNLFGFIPLSARAEVEIDAEEKVKVKFPWWSFLASGDDEESLGQEIFNAISNVLKTKHDTVKNSISNVR